MIVTGFLERTLSELPDDLTAPIREELELRLRKVTA
jgi:hypothetical protein